MPHNIESAQRRCLHLIADTLRAIADYSKNNRIEFVQTVQDAQIANRSASDISKKKKRLTVAQKTRRRAGKADLQNL